MDTSEQYIKMCEESDEIQKSIKDDGNYFCFRALNGEYCKCSFVYGAVAPGYGIDGKRVEYKVTFLPTQDQLQEMLLPDPNAKDAWGSPIEIDRKIDYVFWLVKRFSDSLQEIKCSNRSMEQLWLAFVMKEKSNKVWRNNDWVIDKGN